MSYYFISIGGSGAKILEALIYLTVAGILPGNDNLNLIALDPDENNGNLNRAVTAMKNFEQFQNANVGNNTPLFKNKISILTPIPFNPLPRANDKLDDVMNANIIATRPVGQLYRALYSNKERQTQLNEGFRGHPSIGAAVLAKEYNDHNPQWLKLKNQINGELGNRHNSVKIFLAGSIFGGTGAAGLPTMAQLLRNAFGNQVSIGGILLLPYFTFTANDSVDADDIFAKSENFLTNSKAALKYYAQEPSNFDFMYFLGDNSPVSADFSKGGSSQKNNAHIVDLYGALAAVDFFNQSPKPAVVYKNICRQDSGEFKWNDFQNLAADFKQRFIQFSRFVLTYVQLVKPILDNPPPPPTIILSKPIFFNSSPPTWYKDIVYGNEEIDAANDTVMSFNNFAAAYCNWLKQLENLSGRRSVLLINPTAFDVTKEDDRLQISIDPQKFNLLDPTTNPQSVLTLDKISSKLSDKPAGKLNAQGFGKLLRHIYDACSV